MLVVKCIMQIKKNNGEVVGYRIQDLSGKTMDVKVMQLKEAIILKKLSVSNLIVTFDGTIIPNGEIPIGFVKPPKKEANAPVQAPKKVEKPVEKANAGIQVRAIQTFRDKNNRVIGYRLEDVAGNTQDVPSDKLNDAISAAVLIVVNLTLTSDNKLVPKQGTKKSKSTPILPGVVLDTNK